MSARPTVYSNAIDAAYDVLEHHSARKVDGVLLDATTAKAIVTVHKALSPTNRRRFEGMDIERAARIAWKLVS